MVDYTKYKQDMITLIENKQYNGYLKVLNLIFTSINSKIDIDNFIVIFINLEDQYKIHNQYLLEQDYISLLILIRSKILNLLNNGELPTTNYLYLYIIYSCFNIQTDHTINDKISFFQEDIQSINFNNDDFFLESNIIFLLEILNNNSKTGLVNYIDRILYCNENNSMKKKYLDFVETITTINQIPYEIIQEAINMHIKIPNQEFLIELKKNNILLFSKTIRFIFENKHINSLNTLLDYLSYYTENILFHQLMEYYSNNNKAFTMFPDFCKLNLNESNTLHNIIQQIYSPKISLEHKYSLYWILVSHNFTRKIDRIDSELSDIYKYLYTENIKESKIVLTQNNKMEKRVFLYTSQYLDDSHAPTRILNIWAKTFDSLGYKVIIFSCTPRPFPFPFINQRTFYMNRINPIGEVMKNDDNIPIIELGGDIGFRNIYPELIKELNINENDTILLIGHSCLHFDILPNTKKYIIPTTTPTNIILSTANTYILNYEIDIKNIHQNKMNYLEGPSNYNANSDKSQFIIKRINSNMRINLIVIGNRLDDELNEDFWSSIRIIYKENSDILLHIIGNISPSLIPEDLIKNVHLEGYSNDIDRYLTNMHFYINPDRQGGGSSAIMAINHGIPVITLPKGDVYANIYGSYYINNIFEMNTFINNYMKDTLFKDHIDSLNRQVVKKYNETSQTILKSAQFMAN